MKRVAALFVERDGPYSNLEGVEVWDEARNRETIHRAASSRGAPTVYTMECKPATIRFQRDGNDGGCVAAALAWVRAFGGCS